MNNNWYQNGRRRYFLDFHIDDWNEEFLSQYDPEHYAKCCQESGATAATFMANTHSGLVNWPSKAGGRMHRTFEGRDMLQETIDALHRRGLDAVVYYVFIYVIDYWEKHPEARTVREDGRMVKQRVGAKNGESRFATCCINDPGYRHYALAELTEICENYDFEGIWPDMTFWPTVCYCANCQKRYKAETGKEMPRIIDWKNPDFVEMVNIRKRWLLEFCQEAAAIIRRLKPGMKFAMQSQALNMDWVSGTSAELADCWDWMSADIYADRYGLSYSSKLFYALSSIRPFERVNCWNYPNIHEHVLTRTEDELAMIAYNTIMHDGALTVIDQIDPVGTVHEQNYRTMKRVFDRIRRYEPYLGGELLADVGLYVSHLSNFDKEMDGKQVREAGLVFEWTQASSLLHSPEAHMKSVLQASRTLTRYHVPYNIVTKKNLSQLGNYKVLILSNVVMMDQEEIEAVRRFVAEGGSLYASKETATILNDGTTNGKSMLEDVFGVTLKGETKWNFTYVSPVREGQEEYPESFSAAYPVTVSGSQMLVEPIDEVETIGTVTLPYDCPNEDRYSALFTYPPGQYTKYPAVTEHTYGKGKALYSSAVLEMGEHSTQREVFYRMIRRISPEYCIQFEGYPSLEAVRFEKEDRSIVHILNYQEELPNIPVYGLSLKWKRYGKTLKKVVLQPEGTELPAKTEGDLVSVTIPEIKDYVLLEFYYYSDSP
ncbi:MAG: alpha-L-fucosidase [Eubacteriales bacterium]|nr:alpha-L-fucosidase [Eubacteriales bacterium]